MHIREDNTWEEFSAYSFLLYMVLGIGLRVVRLASVHRAILHP